MENSYDAPEGSLYWETRVRLGGYRLCEVKRVYPTATFTGHYPTGWMVTQEDRTDGMWLAILFGRDKTVVGTFEEAKAFAEATFLLSR